jgi:FkbM family methyltransferase
MYGSVNTTDTGTPDNITSPHLFGWWPQSLFDHMYNAGFRDIVFMDEKIPHPESNFRVEAIKPLPELPVPTLIEPYRSTEENKSMPVDTAWLKHTEPFTFTEIFEQNTYGVSPEEIQGNTVIDIGANIGMFTLYCVDMGAERVISVEAQPTIYQLGLLSYVSQYPSVTPVHNAVHSKDGEIVLIINHHVGSQIGSIGDPVTTITLSTLLEKYKVTGNNLALKVDCEGSEFDILMNVDRSVMRRFKVLYIEIHGDCNPNPMWKDPAVLQNKLTELGFIKVHTLQQYGFPTQENPIPMSIFVEKWMSI